MMVSPDTSQKAAALLARAEAAQRDSNLAETRRLLEEALQAAPGFSAARRHYATLLRQLSEPAGALAQIGILLAGEPDNAAYLAFRAALLAQLGDSSAALSDYEAALALAPRDARLWLHYGHALKTAARGADAVAAYRRSLALEPTGEAWWSLADLKTYRFAPDDLAAMQNLAQGSLRQAPLHFALGRALEDTGDFAGAFAQYARGNAMKRSAQRYDAGALTAYAARAQDVFTPDFFAARDGQGCPACDPIFVVGLPRSGSTLVEQILASHSAIEGTQELPDMIAVARAACGDGPFDFNAYPGALVRLDGAALNALGESYLARTSIYRREQRPLFVDKMPNNFVHTGLIQLILPRARIIDVRRHPLACCLSAFKQHFAVGQLFSYDLDDLGRYYADYVRLMAQFDAALPGRVHRVIYEELVADPEREIRRLFAHIGVPFEPAALRFHENRRAVRTASAEQVRRPISAEGLERWRNFEPWLLPLKRALGSVLDAYPLAPARFTVA